MVHLATILSTTAVVASLVPSIVVAAPIQSSSEEGLVEREPFLPLLGLIGGAVSMFKGRKRDLESDELFEVAERAPEPFLPLLGLIGGAVSMFKGRKRDLSADDMELLSRLNTDELAELVERNPEPFLPLLGLIGGAVSMFKGRKRDFAYDDFEGVFERELAQLDELEMREYYDNEMIAREWMSLEELD